MENLGMLRQFLGEVSPETTYTAKQLYVIVENFAPMMTKEQQEKLVEALKGLTNK